ncbi:acyltransferase family protein [Klebsiella pneumoniae]|uniref:acyltransferase family protein n=1 Tax=Klebsiella pneumoniae TaxID=573 RepID=UPI0007CA5CC6|nr:acyltransferase [Klebsiella pneumoniae]SAS42958.1 Acyltransferase family [Klebsiella pneumoniae]
MSQSKNWSPELDGLRGYASLWVVLGHICNLTECNIPILGTPSIGVDIFILLSGYLMAKNYTERQQFEPWTSFKTIMSFWIRRFFRIAPLFYVLLIIALFFGDSFGDYRDEIGNVWKSTQTDPSKYGDSSIANFFAHISFVFGLLPYYSARTTIPDWSIGLEMQYYAIFPFIMLCIMRFGFIKTSISLMLACIILSMLAPEYFSEFTRPSMIAFKLPLFISGMLIYKAAAEKNLIYISVALLAPLSAFAIGYLISPLRVIIELFIIFAMAMLLFPHKDDSLLKKTADSLKMLLSIKFSRFLGDVSYSVYLLHLMIVLPIIGMLIQYPTFISLHPMIRFLTAASISMPITYIFSIYLYKHIEMKGIALGKKILKHKVSGLKEII